MNNTDKPATELEPSTVVYTSDEFRDALSELNSPSEIGAFLKDWHSRINKQGAAAVQGTLLLLNNTALVDAVLQRIYDIATERCDKNQEDIPELAIIATGGYGRRELCPFSDVDVTFVTDYEDDERLNAIIKDMFQLVMDIFLYGANLKVGYAYRLLSDLGQLDHQTQTTLLDSRFLCGSQQLFQKFRPAFRSQILTADFMFQKWAERQNVLLKYGGDNVYGVEPNVKEGAGCLRDIQNAEWIAEVKFRTNYSKVWNALLEHKIINEKELISVKKAREFILCVRCELHNLSGDARDVLTAEKQESVATLLGYEGTDEIPPVELFMRDLYTHMAIAWKISRKVISRCLDSEISLGLGLVARNRTLYVADAEAAGRDTVMPLHAIELAQAYGLRISDDLEEYTQQFLEVHQTPEDPVAAGRVFARLLMANRGVADSIDLLQKHGVLSWLFPEFGYLMELIPYDAAHDYTVGAHSLRVIRNIDRLRNETDTKLSDYKRVVNEISMMDVLYTAALLHDIGKQWTGAPHSITGAEAVEKIIDRIGWDSERNTKVSFLVRNHLLMAETSRLRDLSLDETIREFVRQIPDIESLNMLYILTYADTSAVGDSVWTEVKGKFLSELYYRAEGFITASEQGEAAPDYVPNLARQRERIRKQLTQHNLPIDLIHEHTRNLPAQYLLNTPLEEMYLHIAMVGRLRDTFVPIVDFKHEYGSDFTEMTICTYDDPKPGLLAKITGVLFANDINVHVAQVFTREASVRIAIDTLWVDFRGKPLTSAKKSEIQEGLRAVLGGQLEITDLLKQKRKPLKVQSIHSAVIDDKSSDRFSLLEVTAPDEKGVVYRLATAISGLGWNIHAARLSIWGSRARDAFYITDTNNQKVPANDVQRLLSALPIASFTRKRLGGS